MLNSLTNQRILPFSLYFSSDAILKVSKNGRQQLILHEHSFNRHVVRGSLTYWRCSQFAVFKCRARCKTHDGKTYLLNEVHNHDVVREQRKYGALKAMKRQLSLQEQALKLFTK